MKRLKTKGVPLRVAGAMSGTSLDGVDVAVLETDGVSITGFGETAYRPYTEAERKVLQAALGQWEGADVDAAAAVIQAAHEEVLGGIGPVELVGFHGQTLAHAPRSRGTLQVGDGQALADKLGVPVVWDFRTADVKLGGEGAPLAPFYHWACARWAGLEQPVAFLNLGGVGNLTWLDPSAETPDKPGALVAFDTGPANAPINDMVQTCFGQAFDKGGTIAASGLVDDTALQRFLAEKYFSKMPPKSLDRNDFPGIFDLVTQLSDNDAVATLTAMCAAAVAVGVSHCPQQPASVYVTGGGRHNPVLMAMLDARLPCSVLPVEAIGLDGDMLEAQAFAYLALRVVRGMTTSCPTTTGVSAAVGGGSVDAPEA